MRDIDLSLKGYGAIILLGMCATYSVSFTWQLSTLIVFLLCSICSIVLYATKRSFFAESRKTVGLILVALIVLLYFGLNVFEITILSFLFMLFKIVVVFTLFSMNNDTLSKLFIVISSYLGYLLLFSIIAWLFFLGGVNLPHGQTQVLDTGHVITDYYLFIEGEGSLLNLFFGIKRFSAFFLEPGQLALVCVLVIISFGFNLKKRMVRIYLYALILSISLAGYVLLFIAFFFKVIVLSKHKVLNLLLVGLFAFGLVVFALTYNGGDNILNVGIISRLEYDDETLIAGNNRTSSGLDAELNNFLNHKEHWAFGMNSTFSHDAFYASKWLYRSSGIKKFFYLQGYLGVLLLGVLYFMLYKRNKSAFGLCLLLILYINTVIRDVWASLFIIILFALGQSFLFSLENMAIDPIEKTADE